MFKFESYITPILLSYVNKYIKNFKQEDSQVSLWGGDASFHNLELRLEVLEQELQLPFSFASGHIHELLIHVPWTKLTSEPITITINTIECILKLRNEDDISAEAPSTSKDIRKKVGKKQDTVQTPPGYVQTVINKIVGNITIYCNNLILKYVEEDIVLSVNVKTVKLQSANTEWKPAFNDISSVDIKLRKLISLTDLTICLDKRNASGKIEMYQEPLLYRCSLDIRLFWNYLSPKAKRATVTRIDVRCSRMDFSLTEQQVPMLMRLIFLAMALHSKELNKKKNQQINALTATSDANPVNEDESKNDVSWSGWAWSWMPSLYSTQTYDDVFYDQYANLPGPTFHAGFYMEQASVSLKVTESSAERSFYGSRKVKFVPFLYLQLQGCMVDFVIHGSSWLNVQMGISQAILQPHGDCFCGVKEVASEFEHEYFSSGSKQVNYVSESLFDNQSVENKSERRNYNSSWDYHLETVTEALLLERTPAVAVDYLYVIDLPEDFRSDQLSEFGSDLEYSNLEERALCRIVVGPMVLRLCSGLFHRLQLLQHAAELYDYGPYTVPKQEPSREQLAPASAEDFEALEENIPMQIFQITLFNPQIQLLLADHPSLDPNIFHGHRKRKRSQRVQSLFKIPYKNLPRITLDCQCLDAKIVRPMYPRRLVWTTCQLPSPPRHMFDSCHLQLNVKILGVGSSLILSVEKNMKVILPTNVSYKQNNILLPQYWIDANVPHVNQKLDIESFSVTCTKAKLLTISYIVQSICGIAFSKDAINCTTLLEDAVKESGNEHLEVCMDDIAYHNVLLPQTVCCTIQINSIRAFILLQSDGGPIEQVMVFSGPEGIGNNKTPLVLFTMQIPSMISHHLHPPIILFHLREVHLCIDPLFLNWMRYAATATNDCQPVSDVNIVLTSNTSFTTVSQRRLRKISESSRATTTQASVHSSSDREQQLPVASIPKTCIEETDITECSQEEVPETKFSWAKLLEWYPVWCGLVICGDIEKCILYLPNSSLTHAGAQSIEQVLQQHHSCLEILAVCFPSINLSSASVVRSYVLKKCKKFPIALPEDVWNRDKINFPWNLSVSELEIYTIQNSRQLHFLKKVSITATIALSTKYIAELRTTTPTAFCVHVDTTPISIAVSEIQVKLMACVLLDVLDIVSILSAICQSEDDGDVGILPDLPTPGPTSPTIFRESTCSQESPQTTLGTEDSNDVVSDGAKLTAWIQFTLARLTVKLYTKENCIGPSDIDLKLVIDMEDIMTSIDIQQIYFKAKSKITSCSMQHFQRTIKDNIWKPGAYQGFVMRGLEEPVTTVSPNLHAPSLDESGGGFLRMTYTRARCNNVHSRWGSRQPITLFNQNIIAKNSHVRSISEIVVKLQAIDFILSPATLGGFLKVLEPLLLVSQNTGGCPQSVENNWIKYMNNNTLPLLYLDTKAIRIIVPAYDLCGTVHDVCMFQIDETTLSPQVKNPLGRTPLRPDIWRLAEQCRMLGMPGAEVEDRQYQLDINGFSISTSYWSELDRCLSADQHQGLLTMGENPALAWNSLLGCEESIIPHLSLLPVIGRMDLCIVAAPAIVYRADTLVCGAALEVNVTTDVVISVSTHQLLLISALLSEVLILVQPFMSGSEKNNWTEIKTRQDADHFSKGIDSGVDCAESSLSSNRNQQDDAVNKPLLKEKLQHHNVSPSEDSGIKQPNSSEHNKAGTNSSPNTSQNYKWTCCKETAKEYSEKGSSSHVKSNKFIIPSKQNIVPLEILLTSGSVYLVVYEQEDCVSNTLELASQWHQQFVHRITKNIAHVQEKKITSPSSANKTDKVNSPKQLLPLIYIMIAQPHTFLSNHSNEQTLQLSCFDINIRIGNELVPSLKSIPTAENFPFTVFETKCGDPHPTTGIPPSFLTIKWVKPTNKSPKINFEIGRPTKLCICSPFVSFMSLAETKILKMFTHFITVIEESKNSLQKSLKGNESLLNAGAILKDNKETKNSNSDNDDTETAPSIVNENSHFEKKCSLPLGVSAISLTSQQIVISLESNNRTSVCFSIASLRGSASYVQRHQGDRIIMHTTVNSFVISTSSQNLSYILLNPWSFSVKCTLAWELWNSSPQVQINADLDCVFIDVGPIQLKCLYIIYKDYSNLLKLMYQSSSTSDTKYSPVMSKMCQHYRDDLRAGAFQFVESATDTQSVSELPLPYQVVFWNKSPVMAWRYPQPRALTKVDIFPVPFKVATTSDDLDSTTKDQVLCCLEYWNEVKGCYLPYTQFRLSETDVCHLSLPETKHTVVACTWRVRLLLESEDNFSSNNLITLSSRSLAACMRIDSFFSPELIPYIQIVVNIAALQVSLFNHFDIESVHYKMPAPLKDFTFDGNIPGVQSIMSLSLDNASVFINTWPSNIKTIEAIGHTKLDTIDYAFLTQKAIIEPFQFKSNIKLINQETDVSILVNPVNIKIGPSTVHTLGVSAQLWKQAYNTVFNPETEQCCVIVTRYVICNDTTESVRFGQLMTDEDILLGSRQCHYYTWRSQKRKQLLHFGIQNGAWIWSQPFKINDEGVYICPFIENEKKAFDLFIKSISISATQKMIIISGHLSIQNLLIEKFECKVLALNDTTTIISQDNSVIVKGSTTSPSILLSGTNKFTLRIRLQGLETVWSGDIPLIENSKSNQPWLVKVPLQEKGQFISIWCRIVSQVIGNTKKIVAILSPLYMIRSHLPVPAKAFIETPGLRSQFTTTIKGRGYQQQLYCPGTIEHSHKLTFQIENSEFTSDPYVPLSYSMIDHKQFFKQESETFYDISNLTSISVEQESYWPFVGNECENIEWITSHQPQTHVQIKYKPQSPYSNTLLVDLQPWALLVNTVGCTITLFKDGNEICDIPHLGVIAPPKLEGTFNIGLKFESILMLSQPLQLQDNDKKETFYMPRISGVIPAEGNIEITMYHGNVTCYANIKSFYSEEIRIIYLTPSYVISNHTKSVLQVATFFLRSKISLHAVDRYYSCTNALSPETSTGIMKGSPLIKWACKGGDDDRDSILYIVFNLGYGWSYPVEISRETPRHSFTIPILHSSSDSVSNKPFVLTTQVKEGQVFFHVYEDAYPQIIIHNQCNFKLYCAQGSTDDSLAVHETTFIYFNYEIGPNSSAYYNFPYVSKQFPELVHPNTLPPLVLAVATNSSTIWSRGISIKEVQEQFIYLPAYGDVKVSSALKCHTVNITVETVSHVEVSAREIRTRLTQQYIASGSQNVNMYKKDCNRFQYIDNIPRDDLSADHNTVSSDASISSSESLKIEDGKLVNNISLQRKMSGKLTLTSICKAINISLTADMTNISPETEILCFYVDNICVNICPKDVTNKHGEEAINTEWEMELFVGDLQLDNQMFHFGGFDFPVILISQEKKIFRIDNLFSNNSNIIVDGIKNNCLVKVLLSMEQNSSTSSVTIKSCKISLGPLSAYLEDNIKRHFIDNIVSISKQGLVFISGPNIYEMEAQCKLQSEPLVVVPSSVYFESHHIAFPVRLNSLVIDSMTLILSLHMTTPIYIALDHSPLHFNSVELLNVNTTSYRLGHSLTMHYLSGAIFGAGWVVGSLELLGSPGGFARTVGSGLRDFVSLPYNGIFQGPWAFVTGITNGSASLMKHITAGTLSSVTKLASSIARNLDHLTLDHEHMQRREQQRRQPPQGLAQGFVQGLTGLGISLLGAVGGIAHHPLQSIVSGSSFAAGVGRGLVGVVTKPLSGAADLVALTGQGLLHGTGWTTLPQPRQKPVIEKVSDMLNSRLKYSWKMVSSLKHNFLQIIEATSRDQNGTFEAVSLVLTNHALFLVNIEGDNIQRVLSPSEITNFDHSLDPSLLCFYFQAPSSLAEAPSYPVQMDPTSRARIMDYVRQSSGLIHIVNDSSLLDHDSTASSSPAIELQGVENALSLYVNPQLRNYFISALTLSKRQNQGKGFPVL